MLYPPCNFTLIILLVRTDADFNATIQRITIRPGHQGDVKVEVEIFDDSISETEEMFAILLRVVEGGDDDGSNVQLLRDTMTVLIRRDSTDGTLWGVVGD